MLWNDIARRQFMENYFINAAAVDLIFIYKPKQFRRVNRGIRKATEGETGQRSAANTSPWKYKITTSHEIFFKLILNCKGNTDPFKNSGIDRRSFVHV